MDLSPASLVVGFLASSIGFVALVFGRRQQRFPHMAAGGILLVLPWVVPNPWLLGGVSAALLVALWLAVRFGL